MDLPEIRRKQRFYLVMIILTIVLLSVALVLIHTSGWSSDITITLTFVVVIVLLVAALFFGPRVTYVNMVAAYIRLRDNRSGPLVAKHDPLSGRFLARLSAKSFNPPVDHGPFITADRFTQDSKDRATRDGMVEILVLIKDRTLPSDSETITRAINTIEDDYRVRKTRYRALSIMTVRSVDTLDEADMKEIGNITFERNGAFRITVLRTVHAKADNTLHMLWSETYAPSVNYAYLTALARELLC
jgi:hypothetical protein